MLLFPSSIQCKKIFKKFNYAYRKQPRREEGKRRRYPAPYEILLSVLRRALLYNVIERSFVCMNFIHRNSSGKELFSNNYYRTRANVYSTTEVNNF